ncbi:hypothetical protein GCK32_003831 [Trichostrongylus colubriformis]|uniref:BRCT domain-containing protein n=1 Tax=Trichostrongylus colubriformis TaxID=6319 RepID=A0AAN8ILD1_TRICO
MNEFEGFDLCLLDPPYPPVANCMSSRPPSRESEGNRSQKRKRGGQTDVPRLLKSPCNKAARAGTYTVFLCGFSEREKRELRKHCSEEVNIDQIISTSVTHVIVKPPSRKDRGYLYSALYYAVVSGAWLLRPSWIVSSKNGVEPECEHEISSEDDELYTDKFKEILRLYKSWRSSSERKGSAIFSGDVFRRVFVLTGRTSDGKQRKAALHSLISAGGGCVVADECWRVVREKPCKASGLISALIIANGEDLQSQDINIGFVKQLLTQLLLQNIADEGNAPREKTGNFSSESTTSAAIQEGYLTQEAKNKSLLDEMEEEIRENEMRGNRKANLSAAVEEEQQSVVIIGAEKRSPSTEVEDDCGLFEMVDLEQLASNERIGSNTIKFEESESGMFSDNLRQFLDAIMVELGNNIPTSFIHDFICFEVVNSLQNSLHPSLLPSPDLLSRLFHEIAKPEYGQQFNAANAVYRLLMFFLYEFPPCNSEGRFYWLQVLSTASPSEEEPSTSSGRRGSVLKGRNLISRVAEFRKMVLETFTEDGVNHNLMELLVTVLEVDLFNMEGCDGLDTSKDATEEDEHANRSSSSMRSEEMLEQTQNSSVLDGVPLSYLVFYDPLERRKRGLDKTAIETCFAVVDMAMSTESTVKLFRREHISIDLQMDIERLGRYLIKRGLSLAEIRQHIRVGWIYNTIAAMS